VEPETDGKIGGDGDEGGGDGGTTLAGEDAQAPGRGEEGALRKRALSAERKAAELEARVSELEKELAESRAAMASAARGAEIDRLLVGAGAIDLEAARLLVEAAMSAGGVDAAEAVATLRRRKAFLFTPAGSGSGAMAAAAGERGALPDLADAARTSGDRGLLLRYLKARRGS